MLEFLRIRNRNQAQLIIVSDDNTRITTLS
jgi:hypothetical protein